MAYFPMMINIEGKHVLVVGGHSEGLTKIKVLKEFGAVVTLVALDAFSEASELADVFFNREFDISDIVGSEYELVVAATSDSELNKRIYKLAKKQNVAVNVVDNIDCCTFIFPAIVKDEDVVVAVSSSGKSPFVVKHIKKLIQGILPENIGEINNHMGEYRRKVKLQFSDQKQRREALKQEFDNYINKNRG